MTRRFAIVLRCVGMTHATALPLDACECVRLQPLTQAVRLETDFIFEGQVVAIVERVGTKYTKDTKHGRRETHETNDGNPAVVSVRIRL